ncbi:MAG: Gfo/Idh/MocA family oxidoreductase [Limisphaerales bacterium]
MSNLIVPATAPVTRRSFFSTSTKFAAGAAALSALPVERFVHGASPGDTIKVALIGMGGRGSGAANQALSTGEGVKLVAVADVHKDRMESSLSNLAKQHKDKVQVKDEHRFMGFDAYKKAIAQADLVILATPPGFRPMQFEEAVRQGKHVFMEKPVCVDVAGYKKVIAAAAEAKKKNLKVGVGLQRHHQLGYIETMKRIHDGQIGEVVATRAYWNGNTPWVNKRADLEAKYGKLTELEYQMRNWYYFVWLCGDHICEQHIHNLDVINWVKRGHPVRARGNGGCETRKGPDYGEIFDHHVVEFTYEDGSVCYSQCRHQQGCWNEVAEYAIGTKGKASMTDGRWSFTGENAWRFTGNQPRERYQQEHDDLFDAIRNDKPYNEAEYGANSSMTSVLGRMATYSGKDISWEEALNSEVSDTMVKRIDQVPWAEAIKLTPNSVPGPDGMYPIAIPGKTDVLRARKAV